MCSFHWDDLKGAEYQQETLYVRYKVIDQEKNGRVYYYISDNEGGDSRSRRIIMIIKQNNTITAMKI